MSDQDKTKILILKETPGAEETVEKLLKELEAQGVIVDVQDERRPTTYEGEISPPSQEGFGFAGLIGSSSPMQEVFATMRKIIKAGVPTVLITGETGTGKELVARSLHLYSPVADRPFVEVNCSAIPENLLEAELFGFEEGAFTDAKHQKIGLLELADGGTLFLDEIGTMSLSLQVKILKVIENQTFRRLSGTTDIHVRMKVIAATNRNLEEALREGTFREDLYYRLNVIRLHLPPLRERNGDILLLADHFLSKFSREYRREPKTLANATKKLLLRYPWPGNVRELKNVLERAFLLTEEKEIKPEHVPISLRGRATLSDEPWDPEASVIVHIPSSGATLDEITKAAVEKTLELTGGNKSKAARILGISRPKLLRLIKKYRFEKKRDTLQSLV